MTFNDSSIQENVSSDKGLQHSCCLDAKLTLRHSVSFPLTLYGRTIDLGTSVCTAKLSKKLADHSQKSIHTLHESIVATTNPRHIPLEKEIVDRIHTQGSPLGSSRSSLLPSSSTNCKYQLHRRNNRHQKTGSRSGKENAPPPIALFQPGRTSTAKTRRPVLANVTNTLRADSDVFEDIPFASSTSIQSPSRKVVNGDPGAAGLKIEALPSDGNNDSQKIVIAQNSFPPVVLNSLDRPIEHISESSPGTPFREALAAFNDLLSSTFSSPSKKSTKSNDSLSPFRLSLRLPAPTGVSLPNAFNLSTLADSFSQMTGDIAASLAVDCEDDHLRHGQYREDAVARDESFHWEEEMKCLEIQCGLQSGAK